MNILHLNRRVDLGWDFSADPTLGHACPNQDVPRVIPPFIRRAQAVYPDILVFRTVMEEGSGTTFNTVASRRRSRRAPTPVRIPQARTPLAQSHESPSTIAGAKYLAYDRQGM
jgi:hypothetical protein